MRLRGHILTGSRVQTSQPIPINPASVVPGGGATSVITITPSNGYQGDVTLSCAISGGDIPAPTCNFAPAMNAIRGGASTSTITVTSSELYAPSTYSIVVTGADGGGKRPSNGSQSLSWSVRPETGAVGNSLSSPVYVNLLSGYDFGIHLIIRPCPEKRWTASQWHFSRVRILEDCRNTGSVPRPSEAAFCPPCPCTAKAPASVGYYEPFHASIIGFLQCELQHGGIPQGPQVIYNIILPSGSLESDFFGNDKLCNGAPAVSWHFHQAPDSRRRRPWQSELRCLRLQPVKCQERLRPSWWEDLLRFRKDLRYLNPVCRFQMWKSHP